MAAYTWTKSKCTSCHYVEKYRGKPSVSDLCLYCKTHTIKVIEIHWGHEKYAGIHAGTIQKFSLEEKE